MLRYQLAIVFLKRRATFDESLIDKHEHFNRFTIGKLSATHKNNGTIWDHELVAVGKGVGGVNVGFVGGGSGVVAFRSYFAPGWVEIEFNEFVDLVHDVCKIVGNVTADTCQQTANNTEESDNGDPPA